MSRSKRSFSETGCEFSNRSCNAFCKRQYFARAAVGDRRYRFDIVRHSSRLRVLSISALSACHCSKTPGTVLVKFINLTRRTEIGANSYYLEADGKGVVLDCGMHPKDDGEGA